jgi:hypothetical protein
MSRKFVGTLEQLKDRLLLAGLDGEWRQQPNKVWRFVCGDRAGLNWSGTKGTLWFDGPASAKANLEASVKAVLVNNSPCDGVTIFVVRGCGKDASERLKLVIRQLGLEPEVFEFVPF